MLEGESEGEDMSKDEGEGGELGTSRSLSETSSTAPYATFVDPVFKPMVTENRGTVPRHLASSRAIAHAYATLSGLVWSACFSFSLFGRQRLR